MVDFNSLLKKLIEDYSEIYGYRGVVISLEENGNFTVKMNSTLAGILANNLLKNACVHNIDGGKVTVVCSGNGMEIRNSSGRGALDGGKIFERFYQGEKKEGSTGLGLAIVDSICRHSRLGIQYIYSGGEHCFKVLKN